MSDDDPGKIQQAGTELQHDWDVATGDEKATWRRGGFKRPPGGCSTIVVLGALATLLLLFGAGLL